MPADHPRCKPVPIGPRPAEFMDHGRICEGGVGRSAGDHDLCTLLQGPDNRFCAEIHIRTYDTLSNSSQALPRFHVLQFDSPSCKIVNALEDIISQDDSDSQSLDSEFST